MILDFEVNHSNGTVTVWTQGNPNGIEFDEADLLHLLAELRGDREVAQ